MLACELPGTEKLSVFLKVSEGDTWLGRRDKE